MEITPSRVQSPSSINTYNQCPRKYYFTYIAKLPTLPNIHTVRGNIVHSVLEDFFDYELVDGNAVFGDALLNHALELFDKHWNDAKSKLDALDISTHERQYYYDDSKMMVIRWVTHLLTRLTSSEEDSVITFNKLKPIREQKYVSEKYSVMGYIDAIESYDGKVRVIDYKTSKKDKLTDEYMLQLGIYALLYEEKHDELPDEVGLFLLKHGERMVPATPELVNDAKLQIENIHMCTQSRDMRDYPKKPSPLCNFCDFKSICFPPGDE
ncbi:MAG: RecB family exonuclease [Candidatus Woesearchaeota archaeon]